MLRFSKNLKLNTNHKILTPNGYENFLGVNKITKPCYIHLKFSDGNELRCSEDHPLLTDRGIITAKYIDKTTPIFNIDNECFVISKRLIRKRIDLYDIVNSGKDHLYYSNSVISHNCEFLGSTNTLISGETLGRLVYKDPIKTVSDMIIYEDPIKTKFNDNGEVIVKDHLYVLIVDVSEGKNLDYSAFSIIDISVMPYVQVATYRSNTIPPILLPTVISTCAEYYNFAHVLVEVNNNPQVADILVEDIVYENVFKVSTGNKQAQFVSLGNGRHMQYGVRTSGLVKRIGCAALKTLVENDKLIINDFNTISELTTFVQQKNSYSAEEGNNDDLAMGLVLFGWLTTQKVFKEIIEHDLRKQLQYEHFKYYEEMNNPSTGELTKATDIEHFIADGCVWVTDVSSQDIYLDFFDKMRE